MFRVSTKPIIISKQNCNYSLRYWSYFLCSYLPLTWPSLHVSGVSHTHHQEYTKLLLQLPVLVIIFVQLPPSSVAKSTCSGCQPDPSSGIHKTVTTASGTGHIFCTATSLQRGQASSRWSEVAAQYRRL